MNQPADNRLYSGHVMHMRLIPRQHRFRYRVFSLLLDIDRLDEIDKTLRFLSFNRFGLLSFHNRDHGARDGSGLRKWVDRELAGKGYARAHKVTLLSFPRVLGYGFNPLSVYFCYDETGQLYANIYEVKNTYGDQVAYVLPASERSGGAIRQTQAKEMYVSPFIEMEQTYQFTLLPPDDNLRLRIRQSGDAGETLIATHTATSSPLTDGALIRAFILHPLLSFRVIALIHWHALRLALKKIPFLSYTGGLDDTKTTA